MGNTEGTDGKREETGPILNVLFSLAEDQSVVEDSCLCSLYLDNIIIKRSADNVWY